MAPLSSDSRRKCPLIINYDAIVTFLSLEISVFDHNSVILKLKFSSGCFGEKCYKYEIFTPYYGLTWRESQSKCIELGGNLASIESSQENQYILQNLGGYIRSNCWIGLNDIDREAGRNQADFKWIDGSRSTFRNFRSGEPNDADNSEDCVHLWPDNVKYWNDGNCNARFKCYLCKEIGEFQLKSEKYSRRGLCWPSEMMHISSYSVVFLKCMTHS